MGDFNGFINDIHIQLVLINVIIFYLVGDKTLENLIRIFLIDQMIHRY